MWWSEPCTAKGWENVFDKLAADAREEFMRRMQNPLQLNDDQDRAWQKMLKRPFNSF